MFLNQYGIYVITSKQIGIAASVLAYNAEMTLGKTFFSLSSLS
jgi:hypothetical protein